MTMRTLRLLLPILLGVPAAAHADSKACKAGAVVFGNPTYNGDDKPNPQGETVRQDPPLEWRGFLLAKGQVFTISGLGQELWGGDVKGAVKLLTGKRQQGAPKFADGPCATASLANIWGIAGLRDGTIVLADHDAHAIRLVRDPLKACTVETSVGPTPPFTTNEAKAGDADGAGKDAKIGGPAWPTTDGSGNIYFADTVAKKIKMVAADPAHTVSTLATLDPKLIQVIGMTLLDDKLYVIGNFSLAAGVYEVDPATKKLRTVREGGAKLFPPVEGHPPSLSSIASDGTALLVTGQGYIWRLTKDGKALSVLAGRGYDIEYPPKYNPVGVYPLKELFLRFRNDEALNAGTSTALVWSDNALYWRGRHTGSYVLKIGCP